MKTCPNCGASYSVTRVLCVRCNEILEEKQYLRLVMIALAAAFAFHAVLARKGHPGVGLFKESLMSATLLVIVCTMGWKVVQKWRTPHRRALYELASLYSDRMGRAMILVAAVGSVACLFFGVTFKGGTLGAPEWLLRFGQLRSYGIVGGGTIYIAIVFWFQGFSFFQWGAKNSLLHQEMHRAP